MALSQDAMLTSSIPVVIMEDASISASISGVSSIASISASISSDSSAAAGLNASLPRGCVAAVVSQMDYVPWDNDRNIVSVDVESASRRVKDTLLFFLFLIGGPGNVINMAVFYKQGLKERVNLCLFALALADELYLLTVMFFNGEQIHVQFTTKEKAGPLRNFLINNHMAGLMGISFVSAVLSAIIATERCHCVLRPLSYQTLMRTRTMAAIIVVIYVVVIGFYFLAAGLSFYNTCVYNPLSGQVISKSAPFETEFYKANKEFIQVLHSVLFGTGLPILTTSVVIITTIVTSVKLRQVVTWRSEATSSLSAREVALTKMLIGSSVLFIVCVIPTALTRNVTLFFPEMNIGKRHHNFYLTSIWISQMFVFINSSFNIFVYYAMGSRYRETLRALLGKGKKAK